MWQKSFKLNPTDLYKKFEKHSSGIRFKFVFITMMNFKEIDERKQYQTVLRTWTEGNLFKWNECEHFECSSIHIQSHNAKLKRINNIPTCKLCKLSQKKKKIAVIVRKQFVTKEAKSVWKRFVIHIAVTIRMTPSVFDIIQIRKQ